MDGLLLGGRLTAGAAAVALLLVAGAAGAESQKKPAPAPAKSTAAAKVAPAPPPAETKGGVAKTMHDIASQPLRDVGLSKTEVPPPLTEAVEDPYALAGLKTCAQLSSKVADLTAVLGPDFGSQEDAKPNATSKLAENGGRAVVNSLMPFRGVVREVSGAGGAQRRLAEATNAGYARRGFLRGVHRTRGCKTPLDGSVVAASRKPS